MAIFCFLAFASFVQLVGRLLSKRRVVGSNPARVFWFEYSDLRAEAVGAAPAEHGTASVEMSAVQEFVTAFDFEARPCARRSMRSMGTALSAHALRWHGCCRRDPLASRIIMEANCNARSGWAFELGRSAVA